MRFYVIGIRLDIESVSDLALPCQFLKIFHALRILEIDFYRGGRAVVWFKYQGSFVFIRLIFIFYRNVFLLYPQIGDICRYRFVYVISAQRLI